MNRSLDLSQIRQAFWDFVKAYELRKLTRKEQVDLFIGRYPNCTAATYMLLDPDRNPPEVDRGNRNG